MHWTFTFTARFYHCSQLVANWLNLEVGGRLRDHFMTALWKQPFTYVVSIQFKQAFNSDNVKWGFTSYGSKCN
jgi:hypothetical protein